MDYIDIAGKKYRIEANWNAITAFLLAVNANDSQSLGSALNLKPSDYPQMMASCINEGERMDGRDCNFTGADIAAMCGIGDMMKFLTIFNKQAFPSSTPETEKKKVK